MNTEIEELVFAIGAVVALSLAYAKGVAGTQMFMAEAIIRAMKIRSQYKMITNMAVGVVLGVCVTLVGAMWVGTWDIVPAGVLAGILASTEASKLHDAKEDKKVADQVDPPPPVSRFPR
jgi:Tfp pilus assembly protein PilN